MNLARPGGNSTGLATLQTDLGPKLLELLVSAVPKITRVAYLMHPTNGSDATSLKSLQAAGQGMNVEVIPVVAQTPEELRKAFERMSADHVGAVIVSGDGSHIQHRHLLAQLIADARMPSMFSFREDVAAGGLMSYGDDVAYRFRRAAMYVDKILKGAKPSDLPIEQPMRFKLVINPKTAKALGITIPQSLLVRADEVIQ
jgi:putative ABC transport system substrate-binding protein